MGFLTLSAALYIGAEIKLADCQSTAPLSANCLNKAKNTFIFLRFLLVKICFFHSSFQLIAVSVHILITAAQNTSIIAGLRVVKWRKITQYD